MGVVDLSAIDVILKMLLYGAGGLFVGLMIGAFIIAITNNK